MEFHVFQCKPTRDFFVVTDEAHLDECLNNPDVLPSLDDELEKVGVFSEMGRDRASFDEAFAILSIESHGYYRFHSKSYDPMGEPPLPMTG